MARYLSEVAMKYQWHRIEELGRELLSAGAARIVTERWSGEKQPQYTMKMWSPSLRVYPSTFPGYPLTPL